MSGQVSKMFLLGIQFSGMLACGLCRGPRFKPNNNPPKKRSQFCFCFCFSVFKTKPYCVEQADLKLLSLSWPSSSEIISMNHDQPSEDHQNGEV